MLKLNHIYSHTRKIQDLLNELAGVNTAFSLIPVKPHLKLQFRRNSTLESAKSSTKIEGIDHQSDLGKIAVHNLKLAYDSLAEQNSQEINISFIRHLHRLSVKDLYAHPGSFRTEQSAIFNSAGLAVYLTPPPADIPRLLDAWIHNQTTSQHHPVIQAIISHYQFEKIHPFLDGNGRVGRLLLMTNLHTAGYGFDGLLNLESHLNMTRSTYYAHLSNESPNLTSFVEYYLEIMVTESKMLLSRITTPSSQNNNLPPRRSEILAIIQDHSPCSLDFIARRFVTTPETTLRYDLQQLQKAGLIKKLGSTRGALYQPV